MRWWALAVLASCAAVLGCDELQPLAEGACGNYVIDDKEDCDTPPTSDTTHCAERGEPNECRYLCTGSYVCPDGYGCGADLVCRRPFEKLGFKSLGSLVEFPAIQDVRSGDFDGDGRPDILALGEENADGRRNGRIVFSAPNGAPAEPLALPGLVGAAILTNVDLDSGSDLVFADFDGVSVFEGSRERKAELLAYPSLTVPTKTHLRAIPIDAIPGIPGDEIAVMVQPSGGPTSLKVASDTSITLTDLPGDEAALSGPIFVTKVKSDADEKATCRLIGFPYRHPGLVAVFRPCRDKGGVLDWNDNGAFTAITPSDGADLDDGALAADVNTDGNWDLVLGTSSGVQVAWGNGDGTFRSALVGGELNKAGPFELPEAAKTFGGMPLAIDDINGDSKVDFVMSTGVALSTLAGYDRTYPSQGVVWTSAIVADFNGDHQKDVVAGSDALDLDFLINAGNNIINPSFILTSAPPAHLVMGDFDGDLVSDLAFAEEVIEGTKDVDHIAIVFGRPLGPPAETTLITPLDEIEQIFPARFQNEGVVDGISDLVAISHYKDKETDSLFTLYGNGNRALTAPLPLNSMMGPGRPLALADGVFDTSRDVVALGLTGKSTLRLWRVSSREEIELSHIKPSEPLGAGFAAVEPGGQSNFRFGAFVATMDLDHDGGSEAVVLAPRGSDGAALILAGYNKTTFEFLPREPIQISASLSIDSVLVARDVDGDNNPDVLIVDGSDEKPGSLLIFWGNGQGGLDETPAVVRPGGGVTGVTCVESDPRRPCELLVLGGDGVYLAHVSAEKQVTFSYLEGLPAGTDIEAADFDRDGVTDVVIGDSQGIQVFRGQPRGE